MIINPGLLQQAKKFMDNFKINQLLIQHFKGISKTQPN